MLWQNSFESVFPIFGGKMLCRGMEIGVLATILNLYI